MESKIRIKNSKNILSKNKIKKTLRIIIFEIK
jgi:hypothetical protein